MQQPLKKLPKSTSMNLKIDPVRYHTNLEQHKRKDSMVDGNWLPTRLEAK